MTNKKYSTVSYRRYQLEGVFEAIRGTNKSIASLGPDDDYERERHLQWKATLIFRSLPALWAKYRSAQADAVKRFTAARTLVEVKEGQILKKIAQLREDRAFLASLDPNDPASRYHKITYAGVIGYGEHMIREYWKERRKYQSKIIN